MVAQYCFFIKNKAASKSQSGIILVTKHFQNFPRGDVALATNQMAQEMP